MSPRPPFLRLAVLASLAATLLTPLPAQGPGGDKSGGGRTGGGAGRPGGNTRPSPGQGNPGGGNRPSPGGGNRPSPGGGNRPSPGGSNNNRPTPGQGSNRPNPGNNRPSQGNNRPGPNRPPQWGRPPQQRPSYNFRPNDRSYLRRYYRNHLLGINLGRRPVFTIGGFFPYNDISYLTPLPPTLYGYLPPPPPGYNMGYFDGYVVVYDPITYFIANVVDLVQ